MLDGGSAATFIISTLISVNSSKSMQLTKYFAALQTYQSYSRKTGFTKRSLHENSLVHFLGLIRRAHHDHLSEGT